mmetsp:Transcript_6661/g.17416  ORF Transcript_6661/g.17416 Transcript_6661/m.17416 type:complete len:140 (+) Transcript_6661:70-489(+)|eukprot:CAMPEP_0197415332 /NCGR_PEP_ID=MMETSP1170-20131217/1878_1 /TAXON_ID=54406 /ORGANISM="Sarcinochrysis sp, Strain CCMP770" /LENGTH=139 /DNA_ID=CAMNT_0042942121 /DNA_START=81 /DNA_END=500 /DNA_ORIENTATION=+
MASKLMATLLGLVALVAISTEHTARAAEAGPRVRELDGEEYVEAEAVQADKSDVAERVNGLVDGMRRLQISYDFDSNCVSSFAECLDNSNCASDEECFFAPTRKKRKLEAAAEGKASSGNGNLRSLLFGSNAVGQCVCL